MIRAVCWDVGGVFTGSPHDAIAAIAAEHGLTHAQLSGAVFGDLAGERGHPWHELEVGRLSLREAWPLIEERIAAIGIDLSIDVHIDVEVNMDVNVGVNVYVHER